MPLALLRNGDGVMSGIRATVGVRKIAMAMFMMMIAAMSSGKTGMDRWKMGIRAKNRAPIGAPTSMKGKRRPRRVRVRSLRKPTRAGG